MEYFVLYNKQMLIQVTDFFSLHLMSFKNTSKNIFSSKFDYAGGLSMVIEDNNAIWILFLWYLLESIFVHNCIKP